MNIENIAKKVIGRERLTIKSSYYFNTEDNVLVRISNHIPKEYNLEDSNEDVDKFLFVFSEIDKTENEIEKELENMAFLEDKEWDLVVMEDESDMPYLEMKIRTF